LASRCGISGAQQQLVGLARPLGTLCASPSPEIFAESFSERLAALSRIHALLIRSRWRGAALHDLVAGEQQWAFSQRLEEFIEMRNDAQIVGRRLMAEVDIGSPGDDSRYRNR
jgi:hypothetical protein